MTLDQLKIGASGTITSVGGDGPLPKVINRETKNGANWALPAM